MPKINLFFSILLIGSIPLTSKAQHTCSFIPTESSRGSFDLDTRWKKSRITVSFVNGTPFLQDKVKKYASEWSKYANIQFEFVNYPEADIRVGFFQGKGSWSLLGNAAANFSKNIQTGEIEPGRGGISMNFGWFNHTTQEEEFARTILHEFGHALCLEHEHKNPIAGINWNLEALHQYYLKNDGWSPNEVYHNVLKPNSEDQTNGEYDPWSIMHYPISPNLTLDGYGVDWNRALSPGDIKLIGQLYPKQPNQPFISTKSYSHLTTLTAGEGLWKLVYSKSSDPSGEIWMTSPEFPAPSVFQKWGEQYQITHLSYLNDQWQIGLQQLSNQPPQLCLTSTDFPKADLLNYGEQGYSVACLTFGQKKWVLVLSKGYKNQFIHTSTEFPETQVEKKWDESYRITSLQFVEDQWCLIMQKNTEYLGQTYLLSTEFPSSEIEERQSEGYAITQIGYGAGNWLVVLSTGTPIAEQSILTTSNFKLDDIKQRLKR